MKTNKKDLNELTNQFDSTNINSDNGDEDIENNDKEYHINPSSSGGN